MAQYSENRSKFALCLITLLSVFFNFYPEYNCVAFAGTGPDIGLRLKRFDTPLVPMFEMQELEPIYKNGFRCPYFSNMPRSFKRKVTLDSTGQRIQFEETIRNSEFGYGYTIPIDEYVMVARDVKVWEYWHQYKTKYLFEDPTRKRQGRSGLKIDIPVRIKSKMFDQIFGGERVSLIVTGDITINGGFRHEKRSEVRTAYNRGSDYNFKMNQTQRFIVEGRVGEKVTVSVNQDSERPFEFENGVADRQLEYNHDCQSGKRRKPEIIPHRWRLRRNHKN